MAVKDYTTQYPGALDTATQMPTIVGGGVDDTRASQINTIKNLLIELQTQVGSDLLEAGSLREQNSKRGQVLWQWNGTDLSQFDTAVVGENVTTPAGSVATVVSIGGVNWVQLSITSVGASNAAESMAVLPIAASSALGGSFPNDYLIMADFLSVDTAGAQQVGAQLVVRFAEVDITGTDRPYQCYWMRYGDGGVTPQMDLRYNDGVSPPTNNLLGQKLSEPTVDVNQGSRIGLQCEGAILSMYGGECAITHDTTNQWPTGRPGLGVTTSAVNSDVITVAFKNITVVGVPNTVA